MTSGRAGPDGSVLAAGAGGARHGLVLALFAATLLVSASLLFSVQPMFARMVLPLLGGSPAVWNTAMVFFQSALLAGYAYAHALSRCSGVRAQVLLHLALLAVAAMALPVALGAGWRPPVDGAPVLWLLGLMAWSAGLPFFAVAASAPLLQKWFAASGHPAADDPYFLYGASNAGSILALLAYPLLLEPSLTLTQQTHAWTLGFAALALMIAGCGLAVWQLNPDGARLSAPDLDARHEQVGWRRRGRWLVLALVPSSLLLAVTAHISTDVAAVPLLWVVSLSLYLLSFVLVFARRPWLRHAWMVRAQPFVVIPLVLSFGWAPPFWISMPLHLGAFFVAAMVCHGELARLRPAPRHLTAFYLWMALGGVLGGAFAALAAPLVFDAVLEYPIALVAACLLRPRIHEDRQRALLGILLPLAVLLLIWLRPRAHSLGLPDLGPAGVLLFLVPAALLILATAARPLRFGLALAAALTPVVIGAHGHRVLDRERSFFGVYTVERDPAGYDVLVHGTTVHGAQALDPRTRREPLTYYHRAGPLGQLMSALDPPPRTVGAVGLGVGTVACYRTPGQRWTFYEIDPLVLQIARDGRYFHYLADCAPAAEVVLGDARLSLQSEPSGRFDLLILDAFSSDAIPVHLLTREAWRLYLDKLAQGGVIALHVSNRNLDLVPVVGAVIADVGARARVERYDPPADLVRAYRSASVWIAVARRDADLGALADDPRWRRLEARPGARPWTDDFSNIVSALRWRWPL